VPTINSSFMTPQTLGTGVYPISGFQQYSPDEGTVVRVYGEDPDVSVVVWNLEPGQDNSTHRHPANAHVQVVLEGTGIFLRGDKDAVPIKAGDCIIVPRGMAHGIKNTGTQRLSYIAATTRTGGGRVREEVGPSDLRASGHK